MSGLNYSSKVVMSVANGVLTMCRRGESCLERRCWSEPAVCCYSGGQNDRCVVVVFVGQKQHFAALLYCCVGRHNKLCVVLLLFCLCCVVVLLCWWAELLYCCVGGHNERWATMIKDGGSATKSTVTAPPTIEMQVQSCTQFRRN